MADDSAPQTDRPAEATQDDESKPSWHHVTAGDLANLALEQPISEANFADCNELAGLYQAAAFPNRDIEPPDSPRLRMLTFIAAALNLYFKPEERNEPFGAFMTRADGRRSAIPSDFVRYVDVLAHIAERARNPALKARLSDLCWILDRKRSAMAFAAVTSYVDIVKGVDRGDLTYGFPERSDVLGRDTCDHLRRSLVIGRAIGWNRPETLAARQIATTLRARALAGGHVLPLLWLSELDLQFGITEDTSELASTMEAAITALPIQENSHLVVDLWKFASRAYFRAKLDLDAHRCRHEAAENLVRQADEAEPSSALMAATLLSSAIGQLSGSASHKPRRQELKHRLVDVQSRVTEEMSTISQQMDLRELVEETQARMGEVGLLQKLIVFACLSQSPKPEGLITNARETLRANPLSGIFGASHLDREGKVIHRSRSDGFGGGGNDAVIAQIAQAESVRRHLLVTGVIDVARQSIITEHHVYQDGLHSLLQQSPAVPPHLAGTLSYGFTRFLQGDFTGATYTLTPMLEAVLRHLLKTAGHDVSTFDDATETQEDRTISGLFGQMRSELDGILGTALTTDLESVFLNKPGPYLRHAVAHGLLDDSSPFRADAIYGCWLILRLCLLPLVPHRHSFDALGDWL